MKRLLVAIDGSDHSQRALGVAADLAHRHAAHLLLVHVVTEHDPSEAARRAIEVEFANELVVRSRASLRDQSTAGDTQQAGAILSHHRDVSRIINTIMGESLLASASERLHDEELVDIEVLLVEGHAEERILQFAEERDVDTIVMGCRGTGRLGSILLGSVSQAVAHAATCSVVMVK